MFARAERKPGTAPYDDYYAGRPELREVDDRIRSLPPLLDPAGRYFDPKVAVETARLFREIEAIEPEAEIVEAMAAELSRHQEGASRTRALVTMAAELGAVAASTTGVEPSWVYSHKGRLDEDFGRPIGLELNQALVFLVEMGHEPMQSAPRSVVIQESALQYNRAARIAKTISAAIVASGARAKAHYDAHYEVILPPLAVASGLGELGRNNILIADRFGSRVRLGAVTTDLELEPGRPRSLGVEAFCARCMKCAENCPTGSISKGEPERVDGLVKWSTEVERCYAYWRRIGTDCGICMACCPFSHRDDWFHGVVRRLVRLHPLLGRLMLWGDDVVYGRRWQPRDG